MRPPATVVLLACAAVILGGCSADASSTDSATTTAGGTRVVAAFYPLAYAAQAVGGDTIEVIDLTPAGAEPHDLELSPGQVAQIEEADLILYIPGFQPALDDAIAQVAPDKALDVTANIALLPAEGHADTGGSSQEGQLAGDPHVWLNPLNMATIGQDISARLATIDAAAEQQLAQGSEQLTASMNALNDQWAAATKTCTSRDLVVSHEAFAYLAAQYAFTQLGVAGLSPDAEPSPARLAEVADFVKANGVTTIYYETLVDPKIAQTVAAETGAQTAVLDPIEGLAEGSNQDYVTIMQANLAAVQAGQGCS